MSFSDDGFDVGDMYEYDSTILMFSHIPSFRTHTRFVKYRRIRPSFGGFIQIALTMYMLPFMETKASRNEKYRVGAGGSTSVPVE
jgi:hypothetical protein